MAVVSPPSISLPPPARMLSSISTMTPPLTRTDTTTVHSISSPAPSTFFDLPRSLSNPLSPSISQHSTSHSLSPITPSSTNTPVQSSIFLSSPISSSGLCLLAVKTPRVFAALISFLDWHEVLAILNTCRETRALFRLVPGIKDVILSRFVPGYGASLRSRDWTRYQEVQVTLEDINFLLKSQQLALHRYPMHALTIISALYPTIEQSEQTEYFASLTQAHSRFVLLLQATVHSSPSLIPPESEELRWRPRRFFNQQSTIRELTFPAPLSFSQTYQSDDGTSHCSSNTHTASGSSRSRFFRSKGLQNRTRNSSPLHANNPPATLSKKGSRSLSIFRGRRASKISAPPPPSIPQTLKLYSTAWRRTLVHQTSNISRTHPEFFTDDDGDDGSALDSDVTNLSLRRPHRRFASVNTSSSASSVTSPSSSRSRPGSIEGYPSPASLPFNLSNGVIPRLTSPHDLSLATLRTRAPILRVFVPCTELEQDSDGIIQCENQLIDSGLWEHLSAGDIVCNLGYVPSEDSSNSSATGDEAFLPTGKHSTLQHQISTSTASSSTGDTRKRWLLFNGNCLLPYSPPDVLPLTDPLSLPTPWYYTHIMNSQENPRFFILRLPLPRAIVDHEAGENWELVAVQTKVRSPHSAGGWALVKQYRWTAKVFRTAGPKDGARDTLGEGWTGEWTLEGEGTKEGRQALQECLRGENGESMEWEFVRERSGPGRMWFKLITSSPPAVDFTDDVHAQIL